MPRVSVNTIKKLNAFINSLPEDARNKCSLCNETLTHIVKMAEAQTGAGTLTVARALADKINKGEVPADRINSDTLGARVRRMDGSIMTKRHNRFKIPPKNQVIAELNKKMGELYQKKKEYSELEKKNKKDIENDIELQVTMACGIILGTIDIAEKRLTELKDKNITFYIPQEKRLEFINRWDKYSSFINKKIKEARK